MGLSVQDVQRSAGDADAIVAMLVDSVAPVDGSWRVTVTEWHDRSTDPCDKSGRPTISSAVPTQSGPPTLSEARGLNPNFYVLDAVIPHPITARPPPSR